MFPYHLFLVPLAAAVIAQVLKLIFNGIKGDFDFRHLLSEYGGMPSSHSAFVVSLVTTLALVEGLSSAAFAVAFVFALITIRDAVGFRRTLGKQNKTLNILIQESLAQKKKEFPLLHEQVGHNPLEVLVGSILGFVISVLAFSLPILN